MIDWARHHRVLRRIQGVEQPVIARPLREPAFWRRWLTERACRRAIGHCWHPENGMGVDWWCCMCSGEIDGTPPQRCRICLAEYESDAVDDEITDYGWSKW